ncbi:MAG TPA: BT_3928 family protein [Bacteroidales bacterium]|nr:BT_3928 family protein [Bacteroidales bacterium]
MKIFRNIARILLGLVFVFSGFVKGVDPLGTAFRLEDYFSSFNLLWAIPASIYLSILLSTLEFLTGISLLFNLWIRKTAWLLMALMVFFTILTFFDALFNLVPDCGCFGDAIRLTNLQTFLKNLVLIALALPVFFQRKKFKGTLSLSGQQLLLLAFAVIFSSMSIISYRHLPFIDFLDWKKGQQVNRHDTLPVRFYVEYRNKATGEKREFLAPNYPWHDSVWMSQWSFVRQRVEDPNRVNALTLKVEDENHNDITASLLDNPGYQFLFVAYDLKRTDQDAFLRILPFYKQAAADGYSFVCLTSALPDEIRTFRLAHGTAFEYYQADDVVLKTMIRSNPGLILLKNGKVLGKWHYRDIPEYSDLMKHIREP